MFRHDAFHVLIEEGDSEGGVAVAWAPNHAFSDNPW